MGQLVELWNWLVIKWAYLISKERGYTENDEENNFCTVFVECKNCSNENVWRIVPAGQQRAVIRAWMGDVTDNSPTEGPGKPNVHEHVWKYQNNIVHYCYNGSHCNKLDSLQLDAQRSPALQLLVHAGHWWVQDQWNTISSKGKGLPIACHEFTSGRPNQY
jgi:hypothetical protein